MTNVVSYCVVIPTYNNAGTIANVIERTREFAQFIIVVNDGSTDNTSEILRLTRGITVIEYKPNAGKGTALQKGLKKATELGFEYAVTIDSDGQHYPEDIPKVLEAIEENPDSLVVGVRNLQQENMPGKNTFANKFSNFWFKLETGIKLEDTQSGFRIYPLRKIQGMRFFSGKYEFELEVLVRSAWRGIPIIQVPVQVYYAPEGKRVSHFKPLRDFTRISILNTVLVFIALLWIKPITFVKSLNKENIQHFIKNHITNSNQSNRTIALSVALGIFMGIFPAWGYQMLLAFGLAHILKLNKAIALVASNISIPPMIPLILFGSFATGSVVLGNTLHISFSNITFETVKQDLWQYIVGSIVLAIVAGLAVGFIVYILLVIFRRKNKKVGR